LRVEAEDADGVLAVFPGIVKASLTHVHFLDFGDSFVTGNAEEEASGKLGRLEDGAGAGADEDEVGSDAAGNGDAVVHGPFADAELNEHEHDGDDDSRSSDRKFHAVVAQLEPGNLRAGEHVRLPSRRSGRGIVREFDGDFDSGVGKADNALDFIRSQSDADFDDSRVGIADGIVGEDDFAGDAMADLGDFPGDRFFEAIDFDDGRKSRSELGDVGLEDFGNGFHVEDVSEFEKSLIGDPFAGVSVDLEDATGGGGTDLGGFEIDSGPADGGLGGSDFAFGDTDIDVANFLDAFELFEGAAMLELDAIDNPLLVVEIFLGDDFFLAQFERPLEFAIGDFHLFRVKIDGKLLGGDVAGLGSGFHLFETGLSELQTGFGFRECGLAEFFIVENGDEGVGGDIVPFVHEEFFNAGAVVPGRGENLEDGPSRFEPTEGVNSERSRRWSR